MLHKRVRPLFATRAAVFAGLACVSIGCRSMGNAKWASAVTPGHGRTTIGLSYERAEPAARTYEVMNFHVEYRAPLANDWDVGFRLRGVDAATGVRRQILRSEDLEVSAAGYATIGAPIGSLSLQTKGFASALEAPVRIGLNVSRTSQLAFGAVPKLRFMREIRESGSLFALGKTAYEKLGPSYSGELVIAFDIGFSERVHLIPYLAAEAFYGSSSFTWKTDTALFRGGLDVSF